MHQFFAEWNPETVAAIQKAPLHLSLEEKSFFDKHPVNLNKSDVPFLERRNIRIPLEQQKSSYDSMAFFTPTKT